MPSNPSLARSSASTNASTARTGLLSLIQSSRHSGNKVDCPRSAPTRKRFIRSSRKSRENLIPRIKSSDAFLRSQGHSRPSGFSSRSEHVLLCSKSGSKIRVSASTAIGFGGLMVSADGLSQRHLHGRKEARGPSAWGPRQQSLNRAKRSDSL